MVEPEPSSPMPTSTHDSMRVLHPVLPTLNHQANSSHLYCCAQKRCSLLPGATSPASAARSSTNCGSGSPTAAEAMAVNSYSLYKDAWTSSNTMKH
jgi:hypothetical protein